MRVWKINIEFIFYIIFSIKSSACWAFSVIGVVEAQIKKNLGFLVDLSPQQLIDCNYDLMNGNWGCDGGFEEPAFNYVQKYGIMNESDYKVVQDLKKKDPKFII